MSLAYITVIVFHDETGLGFRDSMYFIPSLWTPGYLLFFGS